MKFSSIKKTTGIAAAFCAIAFAGANATAIPITGSIGFGASGVTVNSTSLATATSFNVASAFTTVQNGTYTAVPMLTAATFHGFTFNPPVNSAIPVPLWSFTVGGIVYSFDTTTVSSFYNATLQQWDIGGTGIAMISGYDSTPGTWNVNLSQSSSSFVFDSSAGVTGAVPEGGSAIMLLGSSLLCMGAYGRKCCH